MAAMIEGPGTVGMRHWKGRIGRKKAERWIQKLVVKVRANKLKVEKGSVLHSMSWHRNLKGRLLDEDIVAVEVLNILRPTVAIARSRVFIADALHKHPEYREKLQKDGDELAQLFVQEVRRLSPFFPFAAGIIKESFEWKGYKLGKGKRVFLDLYGTNHHADQWEDPEKFRPEFLRNGIEVPLILSHREEANIIKTIDARVNGSR